MHPSSSHTTHHDSALLYSDLDLGFDVETGMVFSAPLNMLADHEDPVHFDFADPHIKHEEECPPSPTSLNDDMEVTSSPGASNPPISNEVGGSILDQLANGNNNNAVTQQGPRATY